MELLVNYVADNAYSGFLLYALYFLCIFPLRGDHYTVYNASADFGLWAKALRAQKVVVWTPK